MIVRSPPAFVSIQAARPHGVSELARYLGHAGALEAHLAEHVERDVDDGLATVFGLDAQWSIPCWRTVLYDFAAVRATHDRGCDNDPRPKLSP